MNPVDPQAAREANTQGLAALRAGDGPGAVSAFLAATSIDAGAGPLWRNLAHAYRLSGDHSGERAALDRALAIDRTDFAALLRMAQLHQRLGEELEALRTWSGVLELAGSIPQHLATLKAELAEGQTYVNVLSARLEAASREALISLAPNFDETESRRINAFVDVALGKRAVFTSQCAGVQFPFLPADEFFDRRHFAWFETLEAGTPVIKRELEALLTAGDADIKPYIRQEQGTPANPWSELDGSLDWGACFLWEYGVPNSAIIERCPQTTAILDSLPLQRIAGRAPNVFFSLLQPGKAIPPHTGVTNTRAIVHLGLDVPPSCGFRVGGETREWVEGRAFAFDDTIEHEAWNHSQRGRAVLILDCWNPHISEREQAAINTYFAVSDAALGSGRSGL